MKVLIIEDNDVLRGNIQQYLEIKGFEADTHDGFEGSISKIMLGNYDIILLDLGLGSALGDGTDICREVREKGNNTPIIMLTARTLTPQKIEGLDAGADDYLTKPFDYGELVARMNAVVRRDHSLKGDIMNIKNITLYLDEMRLEQDDLEIDLSKLEYNLLLYFAQNQNQVLSKENIIQKVWGDIDLFSESRKLDIYIGYLRKKLGKKIIETVRGVGYIMKS